MKKSCLLLALTGVLLPATGEEIECGPPGTFNLAGSPTVFLVAFEWAKAYMAACNQTIINIESGGSTTGIARLCAVPGDWQGPVDVANSARKWRPDEGLPSSSDPYIHECLKGDTARSGLEIDIVLDGITIVTAEGGASSKCVETLGGLTIEQLRWIFSNYTDSELQDTNWDPSAIPNSDNDESTKLWSELDASCPETMIKIAGPDDQSGTYEYFAEQVRTSLEKVRNRIKGCGIFFSLSKIECNFVEFSQIFKDAKNGEIFDAERPYFFSSNIDTIINYVKQNEDAIGIVGHAYYYENKDTLNAVPIENAQGDYVYPTNITMGDFSYNPLTRTLFMNLLYNSEILPKVVPFVNFAFSDKGEEIVRNLGYVRTNNQEEMSIRLAKALKDAPASSAPKWAETTAPDAVEGNPSAANKMVTSILFSCLALFALM